MPRQRRRKEGVPIRVLTSSASSQAGRLEAGAAPGSGTFFCLECGSHLSLDTRDRLPLCPRCKGSSFQRDSMFEPMQEHSEQTLEFPASPVRKPPDWLEQARALLHARGRYLAMLDEDEAIELRTIEPGWTRIGRSVTADIRLDDPSVSRRHALLVSEPGHALRVLDDRSLNGVFVNGEQIEWGTLADGDELAIGRYRLYFLER